jgi:uncharacterized membrane protein YhaH (DUF805 family)
MALNDFIIDPKDAQRILIGASGKLGPMEFAQGLVAIVAAAIVLQLIALVPVIGGLINLVGSLALLFCWVCIFAKRFHDAGQSGWLAAAAFVVMIVISIVLSMILMPVIVGASLSNPAGYQAAGLSTALVSIIISVVANGAVGFYAYRLKPAAV